MTTNTIWAITENGNPETLAAVQALLSMLEPHLPPALQESVMEAWYSGTVDKRPFGECFDIATLHELGYFES